MIIKSISMPVYLMQLEALAVRLSDTHPQAEAVADELGRQRAGYKGESNLAYPLSFLPSEQFLILHYVRLFDGSHHFQIDLLVISQRFILIGDSKNISGTLYFDTEFKQLIRKKEGGEEAFSDPLLQVKRHKHQLRKWLRSIGLSHLPIEPLVIISNPRTIIQSSSASLPEKVIHSAQLPFQIEMLQEKYQREHLTKQEALDLANHLVQANCPLEVNVLEKFKVTPGELIKGVRCPRCSFYACKRKHGNWTCWKCGATSKDAHVAALKEYALLIGTEITNGQAREFLGLKSLSITKHLLNSLHMTYKGDRRWRVYSLKDFIKSQ